MKVFYQPVDIASLVFFRFAFGILGLIDVLSTWIYYHFKTRAYEPEKFQFTYYGFEWVKPLPEPFLSIFFILLIMAGAFVAIGYFYRISATFFAFGFLYTFLLEKAQYLNHGYLFCWIAFIMIFLPAHRNFSIDVLKKPALKQDRIPFWCLFVLPFLMGVVYFFGGIAKINPDWLNAMPLKMWLKGKSNLWLIGPVLEKEAAAYFMAYGGLALDLFVVFFLLFKKTRLAALFFILFFHLVNHLIFNIGIFPFLSVSLTLLFFAPDFPRKVFIWLKARIRALEKLESWWKSSTYTQAEKVPLWQNDTKWRPFINFSLIALMLVHLFLPLRHHLFKGDVAWTEEGHRYSWRMMLRSKQGYGHFLVENKATGENEKVRPQEYLSSKQSRKLYTHPDMILQFAHHIQEMYRAKGQEDVAVYAIIKAKLNGRPYQVYINPEVDLTKIKWSFFKESDWILKEDQLENTE